MLLILHLSSWPSFVIYPYDLKPYTASICYLTSSYFSFSSPHPLLRTSPLHVMPVEYWCAAPRQTLTPVRKNNLLQHEVKCALFGRRKKVLSPLYQGCIGFDMVNILDIFWQTSQPFGLFNLLLKLLEIQKGIYENHQVTCDRVWKEKLGSILI